MATLVSVPEGEWFPGSKFVLTIDVVDEQVPPQPQAMTGWEVDLVISNGSAVVVHKSEEDGIVVSNGDDTDDRGTITIDPADSLGLTPGTYVLAFWRTDGEEDVPLAYGPIVLTPVVAVPVP
jgi:hypothetical protein